MVHSNNQDIVLEKMLAERTQLRQAIEAVKHSFRNGVSCNLPKETLNKLTELGYI